MVIVGKALKAAKALAKKKAGASRTTKSRKPLATRSHREHLGDRYKTKYDDFRVYPDKRKSKIYKQEASQNYQQKYGRDPPRWEKEGIKTGWYSKRTLREINVLNKIKADHPNWSDLKVKNYFDSIYKN